jgi:hypothetical protein
LERQWNQVRFIFPVGSDDRTPLMGGVGWDGIEPPTPGFSVEAIAPTRPTLAAQVLHTARFSR